MIYSINESRLAAIAEAIREKLGGSARYTVAQMPAAIRSIIGGGSATLITKNISANGEYTAVNDSADGYSKVVVAVPASSPTLQSKTATENGTVTPDSGYDGLSQVAVNVPANMGNCYYGSVVPNPNAGNLGDLYLHTSTAFRWFRLKIKKVRTSGSGCQMSKLEIDGYGLIVIEEETGEETYIEYPHAANIWQSNGTPGGDAYDVHKLLDCKTETKFYTQVNPTANAPIVITVDMGDNVISPSGEWSYYTADDKPECDPVSFTVELSADGVNWFAAGEVNDYSVQTIRKNTGYYGHFSVSGSGTYIRTVYYKTSTFWKELIGGVYS